MAEGIDPSLPKVTFEREKKDFYINNIKILFFSEKKKHIYNYYKCALWL